MFPLAALTGRGVCFSLLSVLAAGPALAAPFQVELKGRFGQFSRFDPLSEKAFVATLRYDDAALDPDLSSFSAGTYGYLADDWKVELSEVNGKSIPAPTSTNTPQGAGFITLRTEGGDPDGSSDQTEVTAGLYGSTPDSLEDAFLSPTYLFTTFRKNEVTDGTDMPKFPAGLSFVEGTIVFNAEVFSLREVSIKTVQLRDEPTRPEAVPTPAALAGGLMLLTGLLGRRSRR